MNTKLLRQQILDLAIRGKLVKQDPNDEPASVLLERIRAEKEQLIQQGKIKKTKASSPTDTPHYQNMPQGWEVLKVGEVAEYTNGRAFKPEEWETQGLPIIRIQNLNDENAAYNYSTANFEDKYLVRKGDLLFAWAASLGTYIWHKGDAWLNQHIFKVVPKPFILKEFLYYSFIQMIGDFYAESHGSGMVHITKGKFENRPILIPPLAEQRRIVAEVEKWFALIDDLEANKQDLQAAIRQVHAKVLDLAIHGKLVPQDPNDEPAIDLLHRINPHFAPSDTSHYQNVPFDIPASWEWVTIGDISQLVTKGTTPRGGNVAYVDSGIGFLRAENVVGYKNLNLNNLKFITEDLHNSFLSRSKLKKNDLLITIAGTLGRTAIVTEDVLPLNANQAVSIVRLIDERFLNYVVYCLNSPIIQSKYTSAQKVTAIPNLTLEIIRDTFLPLPPLAEQKRIVSEIERIFGVLGTIEENIR